MAELVDAQEEGSCDQAKKNITSLKTMIENLKPGIICRQHRPMTLDLMKSGSFQ